MKHWSVFLFEWKHFVRSPFKLMALLLFVMASVYGLHNGKQLYEKQKQEIETVKLKAKDEVEDIRTHYQKGESGPADRPWIDVTSPFWAMWYSSIYAYKPPSPIMIYSIGQAEQYGFYKIVTFNSSVFDADMAEEIANPERLQIGMLDFSFSILFLSPLLLLILSYHLKAEEAEKGFLPLIELQVISKNTWLINRLSFYFLLQSGIILLLILYGAWLGRMSISNSSLHLVMFYALIYQFIWALIYLIILLQNNTVLGNTLSMAGLYLLLSFIIPGAIHQLATVKFPANLMLDYIDVSRKETYAMYYQKGNLTDTRLFELLPEIKDSPANQDSLARKKARNYSYSALTNDMVKVKIAEVETENKQRNQWIEQWHWINPLAYFQNQLNKAAETHYDDYQSYRDRIQHMIDTQNHLMVTDIWNQKKVNEEVFNQYREQLLKHD